MGTNADNILASVTGAENRQHSREAAHSDPVIDTEMNLAVGDIDLYDRNPRRKHNEKYDSIKLSIAQRGYTSAMEISRRPGAANYMVFAGGNTTLAIIKELLEETGDKKFKKIRCIFKPWTVESDAIINHLIENDTHGREIFIDKAEGVLAAKSELELELGKKLSLRKFCDLAKEKGLNVSAPMLAKYQYAAEVLAPTMPKALDDGMGKPQIEKIRKLQSTYIKYLEFNGLDQKTDADAFSATQEHFLQSLADFDAPMKSEDGGTTWSLRPIESRMQEFIAKQLDVSLQSVRLDLATLLDKGELQKTELPEFSPLVTEKGKRSAPAEDHKAAARAPATVTVPPALATKDTTSAKAVSTLPQTPKDETAGLTPIKDQEPMVDFEDFGEAGEPTDDLAGLEDQSAIAGTDEPDSDVAPQAATPTVAPSLDNMRKELFRHLKRIGEKHGIGDLVNYIDGGPGAYLDYPESPFYTGEEGDDEAPVKACIWYYLSIFTEQIHESVYTINVLPIGSSYKFAMQKTAELYKKLEAGTLQPKEEQDLYPTHNSVGPEPNLDAISQKLFFHFSKDDIDSLSTIQRIHFHMREHVRTNTLNSIWEA